MKSISLAMFASATIALESENLTTPNAIFHGLGDCCIYPGMHRFANNIGDGTGAYSKCVEIGNGTLTSWATNFETQAQMACESVAADSNFQGEFNVIGLSQGALIARYIVEQCEMPGKVRNWLSIGGPNMGVADIPHCYEGALCNLVNTIARKLVYLPKIQEHIGPAGYFRTPGGDEDYQNGSVFLAQANNETGSDSVKAAIK